MIEVTEGAAEDPEARKELHALTDLGVQLGLDDLGSAWSVPDALDSLAVGTVKIAPSLIENLEFPESPSRTIVEATVELRRSRRICTVAKSVEMAGQVSILLETAVDVGQGYFFSPPIPADETTTLAALEVVPTYSLTSPREFVLDIGKAQMARAG